MLRNNTSSFDGKAWFINHKWLLLILAVAFILRVAAAFILGNDISGLSGAHDEISYSMLGDRFASGHGMTFPENWYPWIKADAPQSYYSYTMSLFLAGIYGLFGYQPLAARLIMAILSTLIVLMIYIISKRLFNQQVALLSAGIAAVYAYLIFYGVTLVTETPFILALLISIYVSYKIIERPHWMLWVVLGVTLGITVLLRMAVVFFIPALFLWIYLGIPDKRKLLPIILTILIIIAAVLPLTIRNYRLWDEFLLLESQFGHVFWNGNHPDHNGEFRAAEVFPIPKEILSSQNDALITNQLLKLGIQNVLDDPGHFVKLTISRLRLFFTFWPTAGSGLEANILRVTSFGLLVPFIVAGLLLNLKHWRQLFLIYLFMLIHTGIYSISWTMIRYRMPLDVFFIMFAASAITVGLSVWKRRSLTPVSQQVAPDHIAE